MLTPEQIEAHVLQLRAVTLFQGFALAIQREILKDALLRAGLTPSAGHFEQVFQTTLRKHTEDYLRKLADDQPALASALRHVLRSELD